MRYISLMHSFGAENYKSMAQVPLRETLELSPTLTVVLFGKRKNLSPTDCPDILRRRFLR